MRFRRSLQASLLAALSFGVAACTLPAAMAGHTAAGFLAHGWRCNDAQKGYNDLFTAYRNGPFTEPRLNAFRNATANIQMFRRQCHDPLPEYEQVIHAYEVAIKQQPAEEKLPDPSPPYTTPSGLDSPNSEMNTREGGAVCDALSEVAFEDLVHGRISATVLNTLISQAQNERGSVIIHCTHTTYTTQNHLSLAERQPNAYTADSLSQQRAQRQERTPPPSSQPPQPKPQNAYPPTQEPAVDTLHVPELRYVTREMTYRLPGATMVCWEKPETRCVRLADIERRRETP